MLNETEYESLRLEFIELFEGMHAYQENHAAFGDFCGCRDEDEFLDMLQSMSNRASAAFHEAFAHTEQVRAEGEQLLAETKSSLAARYCRECHAEKAPKTMTKQEMVIALQRNQYGHRATEIAWA